MYYWLSDELEFPHPKNANDEGILAVGGDLSVERMLLAYTYGIFPWYNEDEPILWWFPNPRFVLYPNEIYISKTMRQVLRRGIFEIKMDTAFEQVIEHCAQTPRPDQDGTWLQPALRDVYIQLHRLGYAHSVEAWQDGKLVGGLYGVALGRIFCGESMFAHVSNASKACLITLVQYLEKQGFILIDCQVETEHLASMGGRSIAAADFWQHIEANHERLDETLRGQWHFPTK